TPPAARPGPLLPLPIAFGRGRHRLEYQADPFPTLRCLFSVPAAAGSDTCPMVPGGGIDPSLGDARLLDLGAPPGALPTDQRRLLTQVVAAALTTTPGTATVAAGDHYLGPTGTAAVARDPVQASLRFALNTDPARTTPEFSPPCVTLCVEDGRAGREDWALD